MKFQLTLSDYYQIMFRRSYSLSHHFCLLLLLFCLLCFSNPGEAQCNEIEVQNFRKTALLIAEENYVHAGKLEKPRNDVDDLADSLRKIGFEVNVHYDTDIATMRAAINHWLSKMNHFQVALFYYSGHGAEYNTENYLFPVDADPQTAGDLDKQCVSANSIVERLDNSNVRVSILLLDACRTNPLSKAWGKNPKSSGLATMDGKGTFIGYAAAPGKVALEGNSRNSRYTAAILAYLMKPNISIEQIFTKVNRHVREQTNNEQVPYTASSLGVEFCFVVNRPKLSVPKPAASFSNVQPPSLVGLSQDEEYIVTANDRNIAIRDARTHEILQTVSLENFTLTWMYVAGKVIVAVDTMSKTIYSVDIDSKKTVVVAKFSGRIRSVFPVLKRHAVAVLHGEGVSSVLSIIELDNQKVLKKQPLSVEALAVTCNSDAARYYLLHSKGVVVIDGQSGKIINRNDQVLFGKHLWLSPDQQKLLIQRDSAGFSSLLVLDPVSLIRKAAIDLRADYIGFMLNKTHAVIADNAQLYLADIISGKIVNRLAYSSKIGGVLLSSDGLVNVWLPSENRIYLTKTDQLLLANTTVDLESRLKQFKATENNDELKRKQFIDEKRNFLTPVRTAYESAVRKLAVYLGDLYTTDPPGRRTVFNKGEFVGFQYNDKVDTFYYGMKQGIFRINGKGQIFTYYLATLADDQFTLAIYEDPRTEAPPEVFRTTRQRLNLDELEEFVRNYFIAKLTQLRPEG